MQPSTLQVDDDVQSLLRDPRSSLLEEALPRYLLSRRWFGGKARDLRSVDVIETIPVPYGSSIAHIVLARTQYAEGEPETYVMPIAHAPPDEERNLPDSTVLARLMGVAGDRGVLYDAMMDPGFSRALLEAIAGRQVFRGLVGAITCSPSETDLAPLLTNSGVRADQLEQTNTSVIFGERLILKLYRRLGEGVNPDLEIGRFLAEHAFTHVPPLAGALEYHNGTSEPVTLALLQAYVPNEGDAWHYTLDALHEFFERVTVGHREVGEATVPGGSILDLSEQELPPEAGEMIGSYLEAARLLGQRTAELHLALSEESTDPAFTPEPFSQSYQRSLLESMQALTTKSFLLLRRHLPSLPKEIGADAQRVLALKARVLAHFRSALEPEIKTQRIRCHGDYHLGQILYTGNDFVIIDFEGEPARPVRERRIKRSALGDVAGLLRSFHYAAHSALLSAPESAAALEPWARFWYSWVSAMFLRAYLGVVAGTSLLPTGREELDALLDVFLLEKAVYELGYELNNRPSWSHIPLRGILELMPVES